jgi:hypothetical protein
VAYSRVGPGSVTTWGANPHCGRYANCLNPGRNRADYL